MEGSRPGSIKGPVIRFMNETSNGMFNGRLNRRSEGRLDGRFDGVLNEKFDERFDGVHSTGCVRGDMNIHEEVYADSDLCYNVHACARVYVRLQFKAKYLCTRQHTCLEAGLCARLYTALQAWRQ